MSVGELCTLRRDRLDLPAEQALVIGNGSRPRIVVIPPPLRPILLSFLDEVRSEVPGRHFPHRWRHTFATELVRGGVDIHIVQRLLGHRSVTSTVGYTHLDVDDLRRAIHGMW